MLNYNSVINKIGDEETLLRFYFPEFELEELILSPLRQDTNPSFRFYYDRYGNLSYKDFSTGDYGGLLQFLSELHNTDTSTMLKKIDYDHNLNLNGTSEPITLVNDSDKLSSNPKTVTTPKKVVDIRVKTREYTYYDMFTP
jgi:hypothetical protein